MSRINISPNMKNILVLIALLLTISSYGQFYYNDIASARVISDRMKTYLAQKVKTITATGYDARNIKTTDFNEWQEIDPSKKILKITSRNGQLVTRQSYQFDDQLKLIGIVDSSAGIKSTTSYFYDGKGNISSIKTTTSDSLKDFSETIEHSYINNAAGKPEKLWRITNGTDSMEYRFTIDEKGNVIDEQLYRRGTGFDPIYYYYDDKNRLTDVVRYDKKLKKLMPDMLFEYDESDRIIQKMNVVSAYHPDYIIWRYVFNEKGLKSKEALFNKQKELTGKIEYAYTFQ